MKYLTFGQQEMPTYKICILVSEIKPDEIKKIYLEPYGLNKDDVIVIDLFQTPGKKKTKMADMKEYITTELVDVFDSLQIEYLIVGDAEYFKALTKSAQADKMLGYVLDSVFGSMKVIYIPNYTTHWYDPDKIGAKIGHGINALKRYIGGEYSDPGLHIIEYSEYLYELDDIADGLQRLLEKDCNLTCDIEGFGLKHYECGIGTIGFAWSKTEGINIACDILNDPEHSLAVKQLLKEFFYQFSHTMMYHHIAFDVMVLIYELFMNGFLDTPGLLEGLEVMLKDWHDTKLISYLATNSCAGNANGLKDQAQEYAGNYAQEDIKDIRKIPLDKLMEYNLVDCLSTWFVYEKHWDTLVADDQLSIYNDIFKPAIVDIIQMQLTGMPVDMKRVLEAEKELQADSDKATQIIYNSPIIKKFSYERMEAYVDKKNAEWVKKRTTIQEIEELAKTNETIREAITFNPNSGPQLIKLLYEDLGLPVLGRTKTGLPETGADAFKALQNHTSDPQIIDFLKAMTDFAAVDIILNTFIAAFKLAYKAADGWHYLCGNFNLGGTVSGRLSSSGPNLQNLPATGSKYAKIIKSCFKAPPGWLFCGIDFNSLEDRISALTTKDPNKLKVYTDGYDGHSLRAYAYFGDQMPDIDPNIVASINSIANKYKGLRQDSKVPTFSLTYFGTYITVMNSQGWSKEKAQAVEAAYHELYKISDKWAQDKITQATKDGYVTCAFGLRVRTPLLHQVIRGTRKTPFAAEAEGRTAGNALGQSWCLLNSRAGSEFMGKVRKSKYRLDIRPCAQIHDAQYFLVRDDVETLHYANDNVVQACEWQNHPDIAHPDVKLGGTLSIFYPNWSKEIDVPNYATPEEIQGAIQKHFEKEAAKKLAA